MLKSSLMTFAEILRTPHRSLHSVARNQRVWVAGGIVILWASLNSILTLVFVNDSDFEAQFPQLSAQAVDQLETGLGILGPLTAFAIPFVWWIGVSALMLLATRLFGGQTNFLTVLAVIGAACAPWVLGYALQLPLGMVQLLLEGGALSSVLGMLGLIVSLASLVWHVALVVIGTSFAARTNYRGAAASCALTGLGCATAGLVLIISVMTLIFLLSGAT